MDSMKRDRIIVTAMKLFNESGFHNTPTSKIAKQAKVSVGTLFNYFETKEVLIRAIYENIKRHSKSTFLELIHECNSNHDNMKTMWTAVIKWGIEYPQEFEYLELFLHSPFKNYYLSEKVMSSFTKFRESILQSISPATICLKHPEFSMIYIDNALHAATRFILENADIDVDNFIDSSFELLWKGFSYTESKEVNN